MQRLVTISLWIEPREFQGAEDSDAGAGVLAEAMLRHETDFPSTVTIDTPFTRDSRRTVVLHEVDAAYEAMLADMTPGKSELLDFSAAKARSAPDAAGPVQ